MSRRRYRIIMILAGPITATGYFPTTPDNPRLHSAMAVRAIWPTGALIWWQAHHLQD